MNNILKISAITVISLLGISWVNQDNNPCKPEQLIKTGTLAILLTDKDDSNDPIIFNIGPSGSIKGSIDIGSVDNIEGLKSLEAKMKSIPKEQTVVLYCGCCPFENCPNIRPAFTLLNKLGYKKHKLLDIPNNLKVDWIDHGFPMKK